MWLGHDFAQELLLWQQFQENPKTAAENKKIQTHVQLYAEIWAPWHLGKVMHCFSQKIVAITIALPSSEGSFQ